MNQKLIEILIRAKDDATATMARVGSGVSALNAEQKALINTAARGTAIVGAFGAIALGGVAAYGVVAAAGLQKTSTSLEVLTGNTATANRLFAELATYANNTPFEFPELAKGAQTMLGFGIQEQKVMSYTKMLGDIASATGANYQALSVVFGQVNATGKLMGQDALQLINNNIPITTILAKKLGVSVQEVRDRMEKGAISAQIFDDALMGVTQKGGFAFQGTAKLAGTLEGRISTLKDSFTQLAMRIAGVTITAKGLQIDPNGLFQKTSDAVLKLIGFLTDLPALIDRNKNAIIIGAAAITGALAGLAVVLAIVNAEAIVAAVTMALVAAPFLIAGAIIAGAAAAIIIYWKQISGVFNNAWTAIKMVFGLFTGADPTLTAAQASSAGWRNFAKVLATVHDAIYTVIDAFVASVNFIKGAWSAFISGAVNLWNAFATAVSNVWTATITAIGAGLNQFVTHFWEDIGFAIGFILTLPIKVLGALLYMTVSAMQMFGQWLGNMYTAIFNWGAGVVSYLVSINWGAVFMGMLTAIGNVLAAAWNAIANTFMAIVNYITHINWGGIAASIGNAFASSATTVGNAFVGAFESVKNAAVSAFNFIRGIHWGEIFIGIGKGIGNAVIDMIQGAINGAFAGIPGKPQVHIPHFASGVQNFGGGLALVGERGPELVSLPAGSNVYSNQQSQQMAAQAGQNVSLNVNIGMYAGEPGEIRTVAERIYRELQRVAHSNGESLPNIGVRM